MHTPIDVKSIPNENYEGYYWYSDAESPIIVENGPINKTIFSKLPFIVEGNFYCRAKRLSIQVKNIDGVSRITKVILPKPDNQQYFLETYIAHDIEGFGKFELLEAWESEVDEMLAGMKSLQPAWTAFAGFIK